MTATQRRPPPSSERQKYARLRRAITELGEAHRRYEKALTNAGQPAAARNREAFDILRSQTLKLAQEILGAEPRGLP